jgi:hypothetical protein
VFLSSGSMIRRLASLPWLRLGAVRQLQRYYQDAMTSRRPSRRAPLPSLGGTSVALASVRSSAGECAAEAWSWSPGGSGRDVAEETRGSPKFLGNLACPFAHVLSDAGRTARTRPVRCSSVAPGPPGAKAPTNGLSTPNSTAFGLAVYASQLRITPPPRKTRFRLLVRLYRVGFPPTRFLREVSRSYPYITILLSQALLGAMGATPAGSISASEPRTRSEKGGIPAPFKKRLS